MAADDDALPVEDGLLRRRLSVLAEVIDRDFDGDPRPLRLASVMAAKYQWPRLRTLWDLRRLRSLGVIES